ncbi:glycosyl hydrolase [Flammeovirga sp. SJP92]|uniref:WD40/YVTN/BNR-like repeat-containing protein n=1 Tax=Flammeovirga sp. SJP92 TaxID=1775430 RepID=UPI0007880136|nr:glycosyl hydrolase [Flammeovirga sp. SJP92]KXX71261.1 glycosyl hydrolase [Flammeovirga sp. SJP92]
MRKISLLLLVAFLIMGSNQSYAQRKKSTVAKVEPIDSHLFDSLTFRSIGPAFMSGRIADLAIDPTNENIWYVAVGSGGVWKTVNAGTTFQPIFDQQSVFSIGCVTLDPQNPNTVWVGTGENVGGRHIAFGDGIYKSTDGGITWENKGLKKSEHISKIMVHPENSDVIMVASQGPLWSPGGERGFFKSTDGGETWKKTLGDEQYTGVTDMVFDPRNPDRIYAVTWEHHRTVAAWMGGGEQSRIYSSDDAGDSWTQLKAGLPEGKWGKTGLAISPQNPDVLYAAIELNRRKGGVWRSDNRGGNWTKMSDVVSGGTGPHYYQEIYASPHKFDRLYFMNNSLMKSEDGGKTFTYMDETAKHGDNHAMAFKASDPNYILVGTDGGVYESFDLGTTWRYMENIPITQFYKVAVDDAEPFYNVYGGTQDNSTEGGPSRTDNHHGIRNADWKVVLNWDGHQPATEPGNPDIMYGQRQQGTLSRIDLKAGEVIDIMPQPDADENYERYNWDAPILVSPHQPSTIYHGSQRLWKSTNRGDSWTALSGDLTRNEERIALPIMGGTQSWDSPWDIYAMSNFSTITSIAVSPKNEKVIFIGTDDGLIQVTSDEGATWTKIEVSALGAPSRSYVNDIKADLFDENTLYVALDNHKEGDYKPYLLKSNDKGKTWTKIENGLGEKNLVWRIVQDHVNKDLMFAGTEFGVFFTVDGGQSWTEMKAGIPTISFRDLAIQRRENDLVAASFGRGFYILDDYSALRGVNKEQLEATATLFEPRKAWWYIQKSTVDFDDARGTQGSQMYLAENPDFGAVFTYYLKEPILSLEEERQADEKEKGKASFPGWEVLDQEKRELKPFVYLEIKDQEGHIINRVNASNAKGFNRVTWDLKVGGTGTIMLNDKEEYLTALLVSPGTYSATLNAFEGGKSRVLSGPVNVEVERLGKTALEGSAMDEVVAFWRKYENLTREVSTLSIQLSNTQKASTKLFNAAVSSSLDHQMMERIATLNTQLASLDTQFNGNPAKNEVGEKSKTTIGERLFALNRGISMSTYGPTATHLKTVKIIEDELKALQEKLAPLKTEVKEIGAKVLEANGAWIEGTE